MRFILHASALDGSDEVLSLIDRLVDRLADEVHHVEVPDSDLLKASAWYRDARPTRRKVLTAAVATPPRKHVDGHGTHVRVVEIHSLADARIADKVAHTPLTILVEDREADGVLLDILVEELGSPELRYLWKRAQEVTPKAIEIDTAGGVGAMPQRVARAVEDASKEGRPVRLFVLCDSDRRWPGDSGHQSHRDIENVRLKCSDCSIPLHVLLKRNAENYIPDSVIKAARDDPRNQSDRHRFNALLRRTQMQRDHFPLKDGLKDKEREEAMVAGLYGPLDVPDLELLVERLFPKRPRPFLFLYNGRRADFSSHELRARDGADEINALLDAIAAEL